MGNKSQRSRLPAHPLPPADFQQQVLPITECQTTWYRLNPSSYDSALCFVRSGMGRYDGSSQSYGILYAAEAVEGAFIESFGRSHGVKAVAKADLKNRNLFELESDRQLTLVDLWGSGLVKIGADARITSGSDYELSRAWAEAIYLHPLKVDGIRYYSRHDNTQLCYGLFDRTSAHLKEQNEGNIVDNPKLLADILEHYDYALL
ncbi:MAG: RES family NAD+ phosphorylase [Cyanobacteria bacterium P01_E01_bin.35]